MIPLFGFSNEFLGRDRRLTRNFRVDCRDGHFKLVEIRPAYQNDADRLARFASREETYRSLFGTGHLPALLYCDDIAMIVEWCEGTTLSEQAPASDDIVGLAACLCETYRRMPEVPNYLTRDRLLTMPGELAADGLIPPLIREAVVQEIETIEIPDMIRVGQTFGDVSLPNFVRAGDGKITYIDTMEVVDREPMMVNLEKMAVNLSPELSEDLFQQVEARIGGVLSCRRWSVLARTLQIIRSKSAKGAVEDRGARQQKMHRAVAELEQHLQQKAV